jgi:hypothetical protein
MKMETCIYLIWFRWKIEFGNVIRYFLFCCRESEPILDSNVGIATATLENEESNQQGNQIRQNEIDDPNVYPLLDDRSLHDDLQNLPVTS